MEEYQALVGTTYTFPDGDSIEIFQIKRRDTGLWVTYFTRQGPGIPKQNTVPLSEFHENFGHLFNSGLTDD